MNAKKTVASLCCVLILLFAAISQLALASSIAPDDSVIYLPIIRNPRSADPIIHSFTMTPERIMPNDQTITLSWNVDADHVELYATSIDGGMTLESLIPDTPIGSKTLTVSTRLIEEYMSLMLYAYNDPYVLTDYSGAAAQLLFECLPEAWFVGENPYRACPSQLPELVPMTYQTFERGIMIWRSNSDQVLALVDFDSYTRWTLAQSDWQTGLPEDSNPEMMPPDGLYKPLRHFGKAWLRQYKSTDQTWGDVLGWATQPESSYDGYLQCSARSYPFCFINTGDGITYWLEDSGGNWIIFE